MNDQSITIAKNVAYLPAMFLGLSTESYIILAVFMIIDTVLGIVKSYILYGGKSIKSSVLSVGVTKKMTIIFVPLLVAWGGRGAGMDLSFIASATLGILVLSELYSILGNIYAIRIKEEVHEFDAVSWVLKRLQETLEKLIKGSETSNCGNPEHQVAFNKKNEIKK